jgi:hypothetical protein
VSASSPAAKKRPARKKPAKKTAAHTAAGYSDELIAGVSLDGAPQLAEMHQLNRRKRAEIVQAVEAMLPTVTNLQAAGGPTGTGVGAGALMALVADAEDLLVTVAVNEDVFRVWAAKADDLQLLALFAKFAGSMSSGEANSSSS